MAVTDFVKFIAAVASIGLAIGGFILTVLAWKMLLG